MAENDENEVRKDFTIPERVAIGKAVEELLGERRGRPPGSEASQEIRENFPEFPPGQRNRDVAAKAAGFGNGKTYQQAKQVVENGTPELVDAMAKGEVSVSAAATLARLPQEEQREALAGGRSTVLDRVSQDREVGGSHQPGGDAPCTHVELPLPHEPVPETAQSLATPLAKGGIQAALAGFTGNNEWYTPARWIEMARAAMGSIDVDPASNVVAQRTVNAAEWYDQERDGLKHDWPGNVWLNPPYARGLIEDFIDRLVAQFHAGITKQAIVLVDNRTDTRWFHSLCSGASAVAFTKGRVNFYNETVDSSSPANGSVLVYLGDHVQEFAKAVTADCLVLFTSKGSSA